MFAAIILCLQGSDNGLSDLALVSPFALLFCPLPAGVQEKQGGENTL